MEVFYLHEVFEFFILSKHYYSGEGTDAYNESTRSTTAQPQEKAQ